MSTPTTGFNRHQDVGTAYVFELLRQGLAIVAEINNPTIAAPAAVQTFAILRRTKTANGDASVGIPDTYVEATGLGTISGTVVLPAAWNQSRGIEGGPLLKETERVIHLIDVPGGKVHQTDKIRYNDPVYGNQVFNITELMPNASTNITRCVVEYAREEGA
jgi:hypothetical protein